MTDEAATPTTESPLANDAAGTKSYSLLAGEMFGQKYKGKADGAAPPADEPAEAIQDAPAEAVQDQDAQDDANDQEGEAQADDQEGEAISSLSDLAEHYKWDPDWIESIKVPVKIDGKEGAATLADLRKSYQIQEAAENRLAEAKERAKAQQQEMAEKSEQLNTQFATVAELIKGAESMLATDSEAVDWEKLRADDPGEFSAKKQEFEDRRKKLESMKHNAARTFQEHVQRQQQEMQVKAQERLQAEQSALVEKIPEWRDSEKAATEKAKLAEYLMKDAGFSQDDVMAASDHRLIVMARKAMQFDELRAKTNAAEKKVAKVPKVFKPGAPKPQNQVNRERLDRTKQKLRNSGNMSDALAYLKERRRGQQ